MGCATATCPTGRHRARRRIHRRAEGEHRGEAPRAEGVRPEANGKQALVTDSKGRLINVAADIDRRHVVSSSDMATHYGTSWRRRSCPRRSCSSSNAAPSRTHASRSPTRRPPSKLVDRGRQAPVPPVLRLRQEHLPRRQQREPLDPGAPGQGASRDGRQEARGSRRAHQARVGARLRPSSRRRTRHEHGPALRCSRPSRGRDRRPARRVPGPIGAVGAAPRCVRASTGSSSPT